MDIKFVARGCDCNATDEKMLHLNMENPNLDAYIASNGFITCTGAVNEVEAKKGATILFKKLQTLGLEVAFAGYKVFKVLVVFNLGWKVNIDAFINVYGNEARYVPPENLSATLVTENPEAKLQIFPSGFIVAACESIQNAKKVASNIIPIIFECAEKKNLNALDQSSLAHTENVSFTTIRKFIH